MFPKLFFQSIFKRQRTEIKNTKSLKDFSKRYQPTICQSFFLSYIGAAVFLIAFVWRISDGAFGKMRQRWQHMYPALQPTLSRKTIHTDATAHFTHRIAVIQKQSSILIDSFSWRDRRT